MFIYVMLFIYVYLFINNKHFWLIFPGSSQPGKPSISLRHLVGVLSMHFFFSFIPFWEVLELHNYLWHLYTPAVVPASTTWNRCLSSLAPMRVYGKCLGVLGMLQAQHSETSTSFVLRHLAYFHTSDKGRNTDHSISEPEGECDGGAVRFVQEYLGEPPGILRGW